MNILNYMKPYIKYYRWEKIIVEKAETTVVCSSINENCEYFLHVYQWDVKQGMFF